MNTFADERANTDACVPVRFIYVCVCFHLSVFVTIRPNPCERKRKQSFTNAQHITIIHEFRFAQFTPKNKLLERINMAKKDLLLCALVFFCSFSDKAVAS